MRESAERVKNVMCSGMFSRHAFVIKDGFHAALFKNVLRREAITQLCGYIISFPQTSRLAPVMLGRHILSCLVGEVCGIVRPRQWNISNDSGQGTTNRIQVIAFVWL